MPNASAGSCRPPVAALRFHSALLMFLPFIREPSRYPLGQSGQWPRAMCPNTKIAQATGRKGLSCSEIRLGRLRNANFKPDEILAVVLRTDDLFEGSLLRAPPALQASVGHCKDPGVVDVDRDIDRVSVG